MGGKLKEGNCVVGGVVPIWVRNLLQEQVEAGKFTSRSEAIRHYLMLALQTSDPEFSDMLKSEDHKPRKSRLRSLWRRD